LAVQTSGPSHWNHLRAVLWRATSGTASSSTVASSTHRHDPTNLGSLCADPMDLSGEQSKARPLKPETQHVLYLPRCIK
jgi:hypothetical protein